MSEKLSDSRRDETKLRKERNSIRKELEKCVCEVKPRIRTKSLDIRMRGIKKTWMSFPASRKRWVSLAS